MSGYLSFKRTGHKEVDGILQAIEDAGRDYHCTSYWDDELDSGKSYCDRIDEKIEAAKVSLNKREVVK